MAVIEIGKQYQFCYPREFKSLPEHTAHNGQIVKVLANVPSDADSDPDLETLWRIEATDGWQGDAFESELAQLCPE